MLHNEEGKDDLTGNDKNLNANADKGEKDFEAKNALIIESLSLVLVEDQGLG